MLSSVDEFEKKITDSVYFVKPISENLVLLEKSKMPIVNKKRSCGKLYAMNTLKKPKYCYPIIIK